MDELELLSGVLTKTADVISSVGDEQWTMPTPCSEYDVDALVNHMVGWVQVFAAGSNGRTFDGDASAYRRGEDPAGAFRAAAAEVVEGWTKYGLDRTVQISSGADMPGEMVFNMTVMEYLTHGWDLATATSQSVPYTDDEAERTLARAETTLPPQYRGEGMSFGDIVPTADGAPAIERLAAFMGRKP